MPNKVLLLQSYLGRKEPLTFPIALATIASHLCNKYELKGFDPNIYSNPQEKLSTCLSYFKPDVVAISLRNIDTTNFFDPFIYYKGFLSTLRTVKEKCPDAPLIVGGSGFSMFADKIMKDNPRIDFGVYLEGELTFVEILENLHHPEKVKGIYYRKENEVFFTDAREPHPIDNAPMPNWEIFDVDRYKADPFSFGLETKRGCAFRCAYCSYFLLHGQKVRMKPPELVVHEISELRRKFGIRQIHFLDSVFNAPLDHALTILKLMRKEIPDMEWIAYLSEREFTNDFVATAMDTGLKVFVFSTDSFTDECLNLMGKRITVKQIYNTIELLRSMPPAKLGFNFFVNGPGYTYATLLSLLWFFIKTKIKLLGRFQLFKLHLGYIRIEPGTPIYYSALKGGHISPQLNLLPLDSKGFKRCFYFNNNLWLFNFLFSNFLKATRRLKYYTKKCAGEIHNIISRLSK